MTITLEIPESVASQLGAGSPQQLSRQALEALVLEAYRSDRIGGPQAAEILGFSRIRWEQFLDDHGVLENAYSPEDLERDVSSLSQSQLLLRDCLYPTEEMMGEGIRGSPPTFGDQLSIHHYIKRGFQVSVAAVIMKGTLRAITVIMLASLASCGISDMCDKELGSSVSPSRRFFVGVYQTGNCVSSLNTVTTTVTIIDRSAWLSRSHTPFMVKGADSVRAIWEGDRNLRVEFVIPGRAPDRLFRSDPEWRGIAISYRQLSRQ